VPGTVRLSDLVVLVVDCQATGPSGRGELLEIAWLPYRAADPVPGPGSVRARLVPVSPGLVLTPAVRRITGLSESDFDGAPPASTTAGELASDSACCSAIVAHFARYDVPFVLELIRSRCGMTPGLPSICTRELARRLLPGLSGFGLRPVSGYLGHPVPSARRAGPHVEATCAVWGELVSRLAATGVDDLPALLGLLETPPESSGKGGGPRVGRFRPEPSSLPVGPGVYELLDRDGRSLYVGKASSLRRRVPQHFAPRSWKAKDGMMSAVWGVRCTETGTALEAALEEADAITRLSPECNRALAGPPAPPVFYSTDLRTSSSVRDGAHPLGPHRDPGPLSEMGMLLRAMTEPGCDPRPGALEGVELDEDLFASALRIFRAACLPGRIPPPLEMLRGCGSAPLPRTDAPGEDSGDDGLAGAVRGMLGLASWAASTERSSRWIRLLACSQVCWDEGGGMWRELTFCSGGILSRRTVPVRPERSCHDTRACGPIDAEGVRRLTVLASEIRRLASAGTAITIIPASTGRALGTEAIGRIYELEVTGAV
jgi:DNA polymerase III epsilon subunit-like protein